jgi:hypothetical protein
MTTVFDVTLRAAELCKNVRRGAATGGSTVHLADVGANNRPDDYYNGGTLWFITGSNAGKSTIITDFTSVSGTFAHATLNADVAGNAYAALPATFTKESLIAALNAALADCATVQVANDITATGANSYPLTVADERVFRVDITSGGAPSPHFWWTAVGGKLVFDKNLPAAGDTITVRSYGNPARVTVDGDTVSAAMDLARLAWLTVWHACIPLMQQAENTDPTIKELFGIANAERSEFMARRSGRPQARTPHLANW